VIELDLLSPSLLFMALVTLFPFLTLVNVIRFVAVITELAQLFPVGVTPVAGKAR